ncbi:hypothetical protein D5086_030658 [Populus alba]|uniref:Uncharacterized protein n=1 Tax=Populus alba TaxID=43335 RepID=A0ACC4AP59_POPAL
MHPPNNQQCKPILTLASALISMAEACNSMSRLKQIHAHSLLTGLHDHSIILAKMLRFAAVSPSGDLAYAQRLFDQLPHPNTFFYNTLIRGYAKSSIPSYSLYLVNQMRQNGVDPDEFTFNFLIKARSRVRVNINRNLPLVVEGDEIHGAVLKLGFSSHLFVRNALIHFVHSYIDENGFGWMVSLCNALIDMYAKCGCMDRAWEVFNSMSRKSLVTWNSMISACANNRNPEDAFGLFSRMFDYRVAPDGVTFLAVLTAYAHVGLVDEGYRLFETCRKHGDEYMGERVVKKLLELKPDGGIICDGGFVKSTGGGGNKQRFYMDSKQEAKMFEALEIEEAVVLEMNLAFLM